MDTEQLIIMVSHTPVIWDPSHAKHKDRAYIKKQWRRIGNQLGVPEETVKKKFKSLRDQFRLELKKVPNGRVEDPSLTMDDYRTSWPWFKMMFFLKGIMIDKRTLTNYYNTTTVMSKKNYDEMESSDVFDEDNHLDNPSSHDSQEDPLSVTPNDHLLDPFAKANCLKRIQESTLQTDFLAIERQRLDLLQKQSDEENDSDRMFLLSLLPATKTLGPQRAQLFRLKVQQLLYDAQYSEDFGQ